MRTVAFAGPVVTAMMVIPAQAEIVVKQAEYEAGVLVVAGETSHTNREISLDGRYTATSDRVGAFRFRIKYLPNDCTIGLFDGEDTRTVFVRGCSTRDAIDIVPNQELREGPTPTK